MIKAQIVIPCFNEVESLHNLFRECVRVIDLSDSTLGFILVNNGSMDGSEFIFQTFKGEHPNLIIVDLLENQGYGGGILAGLKVSSAEFIGWTHADLQTPLIDCLNAVKKFKSDTSFVKGQRKGRSASDRFFSRSMSILESLLFDAKLAEINAQPTVFTRDFFEKWHNPPRDFSLDLYALVMAAKSELGISRIEVDFLPRQYGHSKWNKSIKSRISFIKRTLKYSLELRKVLNESL